MKKKNLIISVFSLLCMVAMSVVATACGGDDDPTNPPTDNKVSYVDFTYDMEFDSQLLSLCNVSVTYTDGNGNSQTEQVTANEWAKTVRANAVPATLKRTVNITLKSTPVAGSKYDFRVREGYSYRACNKAGIDLLSGSDHSIAAPKGIASDKLETYIAQLNKMLTTTYNIKSDGKLGE